MTMIRLCRAMGFLFVMAAGAIRAADDSSDGVLKARGLKRVGSTYVLPTEGDVQKKIVALKSLSNQLVQAARQQAAAEQQVDGARGMERELLQQRVALGEQLAAVEHQI